MRQVPHPKDPSIRLLLADAPIPLSIGQTIPAAQSGVGIDVPGEDLSAYAKGETAFAVGWWPQPGPHWTAHQLGIAEFDRLAKDADKRRWWHKITEERWVTPDGAKVVFDRHESGDSWFGYSPDAKNDIDRMNRVQCDTAREAMEKIDRHWPPEPT